MKRTLLVVSSFVLALGCSRSDQATSSQMGGERSASSNVAADNTGRNARDQGGGTLTATDQGGSEADRSVTQQVRQAISSDSSLSTNAHNVKIITNDGVVTLRGPVGNEQERSTIASKAKEVAGVKRVDNQLEVATR